MGACSTHERENECIQICGRKNLKKSLGGPRRRREVNIKMDLKEIG
jgi:hypothetical protein